MDLVRSEVLAENPHNQCTILSLSLSHTHTHKPLPKMRWQEASSIALINYFFVWTRRRKSFFCKSCHSRHFQFSTHSNICKTLPPKFTTLPLESLTWRGKSVLTCAIPHKWWEPRRFNADEVDKVSIATACSFKTNYKPLTINVFKSPKCNRQLANHQILCGRGSFLQMLL
jgi:hypothetical protein